MMLVDRRGASRNEVRGALRRRRCPPWSRIPSCQSLALHDADEVHRGFRRATGSADHMAAPTPIQLVAFVAADARPARVRLGSPRARHDHAEEARAVAAEQGDGGSGEWTPSAPISPSPCALAEPSARNGRKVTRSSCWLQPADTPARRSGWRPASSRARHRRAPAEGPGDTPLTHLEGCQRAIASAPRIEQLPCLAGVPQPDFLARRPVLRTPLHRFEHRRSACRSAQDCRSG